MCYYKEVEEGRTKGKGKRMSNTIYRDSEAEARRCYFDVVGKRPHKGATVEMDPIVPYVWAIRRANPESSLEPDAVVYLNDGDVEMGILG